MGIDNKKSQIRLLGLIIIITILLLIVAFAAIYSITNLSTSAVLSNVECENSGMYCHLTMNETILTYLPFDVDDNLTGGNKIYDWSKHNNDYAISKTTYNTTVVKFGGSETFRGATSEYIRVASNLGIGINTPMSVCFWAKSNNPTGTRGIFHLQPTATLGEQRLTIYLGTALGVNGVAVSLATGTGGFPVGSSVPIATQNWNHYCVTSLNITSQPILYVNGTSVTTAWGSFLSSYDNTATSWGQGVTNDYHFKGNLDEAIIFNRTISAAEVSQIYTQQFPRFYSSGTHDLNVTIASGNDIINVTATNFNQEGTNLSLKLSHASGVTSSQNVSSTPKSFAISSTTTNLGINFTYLADGYGFWSPILNNSLVLEASYTPIYPVFSSYWDNNGSIIKNSMALFNTTVANTNGTVFLQINGVNLTATNLTADMYNISYVLSYGGNYAYQWLSWSNGTIKDFNISETKTYTVNATSPCDVGDLDSNCYIVTTKNLASQTLTGLGNLIIQSGGSLFNNTAGIITINLGGNLTIESGGNISLYGKNGTATHGGNLTINVHTINLSSGSKILTMGSERGTCSYCASFGGDGGKIVLNVTKIYLDGIINSTGGSIAGERNGWAGDGGSLFINTTNDFEITGTIQLTSGGGGDRCGIELPTSRRVGGKISIGNYIGVNVSGIIDTRGAQCDGLYYNQTINFFPNSFNLRELNVKLGGNFYFGGNLNVSNLIVSGVLGPVGQGYYPGGNLSITADVLNLSSSGNISARGGDIPSTGYEQVGGYGGLLNITANTAYLDGTIEIRGGDGNVGRGEGGWAGKLFMNIKNDYALRGSIIGKGGVSGQIWWARGCDGGTAVIYSPGANVSIPGIINLSIGGSGDCYIKSRGGLLNITAYNLSITNFVSAIGNVSGIINLNARNSLTINSSVDAKTGGLTTGGLNGSVYLEYSNIMNLTSSTISPDPYITRNTTNAKLKYLQQIFSSNAINYDNAIKISSNNISVDSSSYSQLNKSAELWFYNSAAAHPYMKRNEVTCPSSICTEIGTTGTTYKFNVTSFTDYSVGDDTIAPNGSLISPADGLVTNVTSNNFTANVSDNYNLANATLTVEDTSNKWLDFDGVDDTVEVPASNSLNTSAVSLSLWINPDLATQNSYAGLISKTGPTYLFMYDNTGTALDVYLDTSAGARDVATSSHGMAAGNWYNLVMTYLEGNLSVYKNGNLFYNTSSTGTLTSYVNTLRIGTDRLLANRYFNGSIDEVRIYNRSLSASEISNIYTSGLTRNPKLTSTGLVAWYDFNEGSGTNLIDRALGLNNGTISGAVYSYQYRTTTNFVSGTVNTVVGTVVTLVQGVYKWFYGLFDTAGNYYQTENRTLTITTSLSSCQELNSENTTYQLTSNVVSTATCFNITANNVTLDCLGKEINYSNTAVNPAGYGVYSIANFTIVKNCNIKTGNANPYFAYGIYFNYANNGTIINNTIDAAGSRGMPIYFLTSNSNTITNNTILSTRCSEYCNGASLSGSLYNTIFGNNITTGGYYGYAVNLESSSNSNNVKFNSITQAGAYGYGILLSSSSANSLISNNLTTALDSNGGIYLTASSSNNFTSNIAKTTTGKGVYFISGSLNTFTTNQVNTSLGISYYSEATTLANYNNSIDSTNLAEGLPVLYNYSISNQIIQNSNNQYGQIICAWCQNVTYNNISLNGDGISFYYTGNSTITNSTLNMRGGSLGAYLYSSSQNDMENNNITTISTTSYGYGVYLISSNLNTVKLNNITTTGTYGKGIYLSASSNNNLTSNIIGTSGGEYSHCIQLESASNSNNIRYNILKAGIVGNYYPSGVSITSGTYNTIDSNNITESGYHAPGIFLYSSSANQLTNNTITTLIDYTYGIYFYSNANNNYVDNNQIRLVANPLGAYGALVVYDSNNNTVNNSYIQSAGYAYRVSAEGSNNSIYNTIINSTLTNIKYDDNAFGITNLTNVTLVQNNISFGSGSLGIVNAHNYLDAYANYTNGTVAGNANITGFDVNGNLVFNNLTDASGNIARQTLLAYTQNVTGITLYTNHTINGTNPARTYTISQQVNMSQGNKNLVFMFDTVNPNASLISPNSSLYSNNATINFTANISDVGGAGIKNATLNIYNSSESLINQTTTTFTDTVNTVVGTVVTVVDGVYHWFYSLFDWAGNQFTTGNNTLTIDTAKPLVSFVSPTPENNSGRSGEFSVNVTISDLYLKNISYSWNNTISNLIDLDKLTDGLVLMMNFNNESSYGENATYARDYSGFGNNGTIVGAVWNSSGKYGSSLQFDGVDDIVRVSNSNSLNIYGTNKPISVSFWFRFLKDQGNKILLHKGTFPTYEADIYCAQSSGSGTCTFAVNDNGAYKELTSSSFSSNNDWHQITGVYNTTHLIVYIDGIIKSTPLAHSGIVSQDTYDLVIGSYGAEVATYAFNGSIDEVMIYNRSLSSQEINQLYYSQLRNYPDTGKVYLANYNGTTETSKSSTLELTKESLTLWNLVINQSGMNSGSSYLYSISASDLAGNTNSTETRLIRGNAAPSFNAINITPNSTMENDPNVFITINANISDTEGNFDSATLQWRNSSLSYGKNNITMNNLTSISSSWIMNASFTLPSYEDNISFRIIVNDTLGEIGYSANYTIASFWDCGWIYGTSISSTAGWDINKEIGSIIINNTGDASYSVSNCSLDFRLTYDLTEGRVYFDEDYVKPSNTYTIAAGGNTTIKVNATFATEIKQENSNITITEFRARTANYSANISTVLVTNQQGPYLYEKISSYPTSVYLTDNEFNLIGYIRNLMGSITINDNNTAYNVSLFFILPDGITNASGAYYTNYSNITDNSMNYLNTNLTFSDLASMTSGVKTFTLKALGQNRTGGLITDAYGATYLQDAVSVTFLCYNVSDGVIVTACGSLDGDYVAPTTTTSTSTSTGSGGGGGGGGTISGTEVSQGVFELIRGQEQSFELQIKNKYNSTMRNVKVSVSGINSEYIKLDPEKIASIGPYATQIIKVTITTPKYFTARKYTLKFDIEGNLVVGNLDNSYRELKTITLLIADLTSKEASQMLNQSYDFLKEMNSSGMYVQQITTLFETMNSQFKSYDFLALKDTFATIKELHDSAIESDKAISQIDSLVIEAEKSGITVTETKRLLYLAKSAFERGDYLSSLERIKEAQLSYALETKGEFNPLYYVKNNPIQSSAFVIIFAILSYSSFLLVKLRLYKRKLMLLDEEEELIIGLMKVIQKECFEEAKMSMDEYEEAMIQYEARLNKIIQEKINTETKLAYLFKIKGRGNALSTERTRLIELIKETQKDYMERGKLETRIYENMLRGYSSRLSEVEQEIALVEAQRALAGKGFIGEKSSFISRFFTRMGLVFSSLFKRKEKQIKIRKIEREIIKQKSKERKISLFSRISSWFKSKAANKKSIAHIPPKNIHLDKTKPKLSLKAETMLAEEKAEELWNNLRNQVKKPGFFASIFKKKEIKSVKLSDLKDANIKFKSKYKEGTKEWWNDIKMNVKKDSKFSFKKWFRK